VSPAIVAMTNLWRYDPVTTFYGLVEREREEALEIPRRKKVRKVILSSILRIC
jgi:hypothetical protein